jgi:hypothetical protein
MKKIIHAALCAATLAAVVASQTGCGTLALHNMQVSQQYAYEAEMEAQGLVPLRKSDADIWAETWWWKVPLGIGELALYGYAAHETLKNDGNDAAPVYNTTNNYPPPEDETEEEDADGGEE